ncbi:MAG: hypothetical protein LUF90_02610 [Rikenellaceae bacterium]|nr:hypothetical protein [Rikenellaceae bacterium]
MKKFIMAIILAVTVTGFCSAQDYNWGIGVRGGAVATGITAKVSIDGQNAVEGILSLVNGVNFYGLYERHMPVISSGFSFYYGAGGNIGSWKRHSNKKFTVGIDGIIGLEYKIREVPLAFSVDYKPGLNFIGHSGFRGWYDFGASVKVAF